MVLLASRNMHQHLNKPKIGILKLAIHSALTSVIFMTGAAAFAETSEVILPQVDVTAPRMSDTKPVKGYNAKKSASSTRTDTELRDTPQSITVIPQEIGRAHV